MENDTSIGWKWHLHNFCFKDAHAFETGLSDYYRLIYSMVNTTFKNETHIKEILLTVVTRTLTKET